MRIMDKIQDVLLNLDYCPVAFALCFYFDGRERKCGCDFGALDAAAGVCSHQDGCCCL